MGEHVSNEHEPRLLFRTAANQTEVLKVSNDKATRRIDFGLIAKISMKNFKVSAHKDYVLSEDEKSQIDDWIKKRSSALMTYEAFQLHQKLEALGALADLRNAINQAEAKALRKGAKPASSDQPASS